MKILTFDIEDWFHLLDNSTTKSEDQWINFKPRIHQNLDRIFSLLEKSNTKATFFVLGWIAEKFPEIVKQISSLGYELGSHTHFHQLLFNQDQKSFKNDVERSIKTLEDISGQNIKYFRAPGFSLTVETLWALEVIAGLGIEIDCSIFPAHRAHGGFPSYKYNMPSIVNYNGIEIKEFPMSNTTIFNKTIIFSGGGYFRLLPYWMIKPMTENNDYVMTYFHPRDFDSDQPMIDGLSVIKRFKSYYGLGNAFEKLEKLISDFEFLDLYEADKLVNWDNVKIMELG